MEKQDKGETMMTDCNVAKQFHTGYVLDLACWQFSEGLFCLKSCTTCNSTFSKFPPNCTFRPCQKNTMVLRQHVQKKWVGREGI